MPGTVPTLFVVDDDDNVRRALARVLSAEHYEVRTFSCAEAFFNAHDPNTTGCLILDLAMPGVSGLEVQSRLAASGCRRPIIFLSGQGSIPTSVTAMRAGAVTFLTKPVEYHELLTAVEEALCIDAEKRQELSLRTIVTERLATLTPRERQVLAHVVAGRLNKQIAGDLGTVIKTIKVHRARVMQKMGVRSVAELVQITAAAGESLQIESDMKSDMRWARFPTCYRWVMDRPR